MSPVHFTCKTFLGKMPQWHFCSLSAMTSVSGRAFFRHLLQNERFFYNSRTVSLRITKFQTDTHTNLIHNNTEYDVTSYFSWAVIAKKTQKIRSSMVLGSNCLRTVNPRITKVHSHIDDGLPRRQSVSEGCWI